MNGYAFGPFCLFPSRFLLTGGNSSCQLTPRLLAVLQYLIEKRERVVSKDELLDHIWQGSFIEEGNVGRAVSTLRGVLSDVAENPTYIKTINRVGYRFIHPVVAVADVDPLIPPSRSNTSPANESPFVGRESELEFLKQAFLDCERGRSIVVSISGEAGIGKTALVDTLISEVSAHSFVARSQCPPRLMDGEECGTLTDAFVDFMKMCPDVELRTGLDGILLRQASMNRKFAAAVSEIAGKRPLILFIDDVQWADAGTADVIGYLCSRLASARLLLVLTYRKADLLRSGQAFRKMNHEIATRGVWRHLNLKPLTSAAIEQYLAADFQSGITGLADHLFRYSEGNPLFMVSLLDHLRAGGIIRDSSGKLRLRPALQNLPPAIPPRLESLLAGKIDQLEPADRTLLAAASAQGKEFDSATLADVLSLPPGEVEERLHEILLTHEFIRHLGQSELRLGDPTQSYQFLHILYVVTLQQSLPPGRLSSLKNKLTGALRCGSANDSVTACRM